MKHVLFISAFCALFFTSCKKNSTDKGTAPANVIIETEGGVTTTHRNAEAIYGVSSFSGNYVMNITSLDAAGKETIELIISSADSLKANTPYVPLNILYGPYQSNNGGSGTITITTLTATQVKGTFSGDVVSLSTGVTRHLTNGSFDTEIAP